MKLRRKENTYYLTCGKFQSIHWFPCLDDRRFIAAVLWDARKLLRQHCA